MPSRSATPAPAKLKKESQALPSYGVYGADSGSQYEPSKEAADEDDAADAEMTELESQTPVHFHSLLYMFINDSQKLSFCHASAMPFCR